MPSVYIEGDVYRVAQGRNLLEASLALGFDLPYFCWHPALGSVGACRQCAVKQFKDENDRQGRIVMACMTPADEGARISIRDPEAVAFRASVIEWLMTNHPHDCPVCDEGGECHLQDMTVMTGHAYRRHRFEKRTFRNQYLGPFLNHEMNRCITCYRCVRFYNDYAGGKDLQALSIRNQVYFGRYREGVLESPFSGNLVEICPTGVFTDRTFKAHYTRKWDLQTAPSVCVHCGLGCNTIPGERYGELRRVLNRYNGEVNGYFLCDRGRFGYEFAGSSRRIRGAQGRDGFPPEGEPEAALRAGIAHLARILREAAGVVGIGSPRASLEANYALRSLVGPEAFCNGLSDEEAACVRTALRILGSLPARIPSLRAVESSDAVLVLGEDVTQTAPRLDLALRQSVRRQPLKNVEARGFPLWNDACARLIEGNSRGPLYVASPAGTALDEISRATLRAAPEEIARFGYAVAHHLDPGAPGVADLDPETDRLARRVAEDLRAAERPLVVSGTGCLHVAVLEAAANVAAALYTSNNETGIFITVPECNTLGAALIEERGVAAAIEAVEAGRADTLIVLENDLRRRMSDERFTRLLRGVRHLVVIDHTQTGTAERAELVLPCTIFAESTGSYVSNEGRLQRAFQVYVPAAGILPAWRILSDVLGERERAAGALEAAGAISESGRYNPAAPTAGTTADRAGAWPTLADLHAELARSLPHLAPVRDAAPGPELRIAGQKIPRHPHRYSGRTALSAHITISEPKPPEDPDSPMSFSMEGYLGAPPAPLTARFWAPGWNSVQALNRFQEEIAGPLRGGDPGRRLIEARAERRFTYFNNWPPVFSRREDSLRAVALFHIFGSEELSVLSPAVAELAPQAYAAVNPREARRLGLKTGDRVLVGPATGAGEPAGSGRSGRAGEEASSRADAGSDGEDASAETGARLAGGRLLMLQVRDDLPEGAIGLPFALPEMTGFGLPAWCWIAPAGGRDASRGAGDGDGR